jgi:hypothetical protein
MARPARRTVSITSAALADLERLGADDPALPRLALAKLRDYEAGRIDAVPLRSMAKTGDLGDCRKIYFGPGNPPSHRIVVHHIDENTLEVVEVVTTEARQDAYAYLLAANRLGRLPRETKPEFDRVHQTVIARRARKKPRPSGALAGNDAARRPRAS